MEPLIKDKTDVLWRHWVHYHKILCWCLKWSSSLKECQLADAMIRECHALWLSKPQLRPWYHLKTHNMLKAARNYICNAPLRISWAMKCEMYLRYMKGLGVRSNFKNVPLTMTTDYAEDRGFLWATDSKSSTATGGHSLRHIESIRAGHPFYEVLHNASDGGSVPIAWYKCIVHQGLQYTEGLFVMYSIHQTRRHDLKNSTVGSVQSCLECNGEWWLVVHQLARSSQGCAATMTVEGCLCVDCSLLDTSQLSLVPLKPSISVTPFWGVSAGGSALILVEQV